MRAPKTLTAVLLLVSSVSPCLAQANKPLTMEIDVDLRTRMAAVGRWDTRFYSDTFGLRSNLKSGWGFNLTGKQEWGSFLAQQATVEKQWSSQRLQLGLVRLPFGIYDTRETYGSGLIDYPLMRGDFAFVGVNWAVPGAMWSGGSPSLQWELAQFNGRSSGIWGNANLVGGTALRLQTYVKGVILGASHWSGFSNSPSWAPDGGHQDMHMNGLDLRLTRPHLLIRGEYLFGSVADDTMHGGYLDIYYHLPKFAKWTLVGRGEALSPGDNYGTFRQVTLGVRYAVAPQWTLSVNWRRNNRASAYKTSWTPYAGRQGDFLVQLYRKFTF